MTRQKSFAVFLCVMLLAQIIGTGAAELPMEPVPLEGFLPVETTVTEPLINTHDECFPPVAPSFFCEIPTESRSWLVFQP